MISSFLTSCNVNELSVNFFDELIASSLQILIRHVEIRSDENSLPKQFRL